MAVIRDMIPPFELFQPTSTEAAVELLDQHGRDAWVMAGGIDSFDWFKDRIKRPKVVVDLGSVESLKGVRSTENGLEIGAMSLLIDVIRNSEVQAKYKMLADAATQAASPQIRNQGTIGGNVMQDTRCWYYRDGWTCYRAGGNICYADTPTAMNREHCILGASRCVAVSPSDTAPVFIALDAKMVVQNSSGERVFDAEDFFIGPAIDITRMTVVEPGDVLVGFRLPATWAGAQFYFEKARDRNAWDFPIANIASARIENNGAIQDIRLAVGGVAPYPVRLTAVEDAVRGQSISEETAERAGEIAIQGVKPLAHNRYKISIMQNLVKRAVRGVQS